MAEPGRLLDSLNTCVLLIDCTGEVLHLNFAAESLFGVSRNQARGRRFQELLMDASGLLTVIERVLQTNRPFSQRELPVRPMAADAELIVDCWVTPFEETVAPSILIEITDATEHQRISRETALLTQSGGRRAMIRQLAHEIKNPLGGLRGAAQLLARQLPDAALREYTAVIISEADRLATLVDTLLGPSQAPRKESVNVHELLHHVSHLLVGAAPPGVVIERDYDPSLPPLWVDRDQIIQAMLNLGRNACQALEAMDTPAPRVTLRTRALTNVNIGAHRHRLVASVQFEDNGPGVPEQLRDSLFYPLVTGRANGTGLGLAVAQELVNRHDGLIEFVSRPGLTTFTILLPFHVSDTGQAFECLARR